MAQPDEELLKPWSAAAMYWEKHRDIIGRMFAPATQALVEDAGIGRGKTVLDVGTGPGEPALSLAALVGPEGKVWGIDPVAEMVVAARRAAEQQGLGQVEFEVAFADNLPFPDATFDAVVSRFGAMYFPVPVDAVREILRVLKPGGKLAMAVWHFAEFSPFLSLVPGIVDRYVAPEPLPPDAPDTFRFAAPGKLREILAEAGVAAPVERLLRFEMPVARSAEEVWTLRCEMSDKLREKLATLAPEVVARIRAEAIEGFAAYATDGGMSFPAEVWIVSGTRSR